MPNDSRRIGFAALSHPELFPSPGISTFFRPTVPSKSFMTSSSSSRAFASSELLRFDSSLVAFRRELHLALGFSDLFATSPVRSHFFAEASIPPLRSVIRFSRPLDVFLRTRACRLISSRCHVQVPARSGASLPAQPSLPLRKVLPPGRCFLVSLTDLRRLPLDEDLGFEAFIRARPRSLQHRYSQSCTPLPSSGSRSSRLSLPSVGRSLPASSALDVSSLRLRYSRSRSEFVLSVSPD